MSSKTAGFSKSLRTIRRLIEKRNGKSAEKIGAQVTAGTELITKNLYDASNSPETCGFLVQLCEHGLVDRAKNLLGIMVDLHPKNIAANPKIGDLFKSLIVNGEEQLVISLIDNLTTGKIDQGPSLPSMAEELAGNESVISAMRALVNDQHGSRVSLQLHRLAIMAGKELSKNSKLPKLLDTLTEHGFSSEVDLINSVMQKDPPGTYR